MAKRGLSDTPIVMLRPGTMRAGGLLATGGLCASMFLAAHLGILEVRWLRYHKYDIVARREAKERPTPARFQEPYSSATLIDLASRGLLDGYHGRDLATDAPLDRFEIADLLGRFLVATNARLGRVFKLRASLDHQTVLIPVRADAQEHRWGLFEVEAAMAERLIIPTREREFWQQPMERYWLAAILGRLLDRMAPEVTLLPMHYVYPPEHYADFSPAGFPPFALSRRAIEYGLLESQSPVGSVAPLFAGHAPVRGHVMAVVIQRLDRITRGYAW